MVDRTNLALSRRNLLKYLGLTSAAALLAGCGGAAAPTQAPAPAAATKAPAAATSAPAAAATTAPAAAATTAPAVGAATPVGKRYEITFASPWGQADIDAVLKMGVKEALPNIDLKFILTPNWTDFWVKTQTALAGNAGPDVCYLKEAHAVELAWKKLVIPLDDFAKRDGVTRDQFLAMAWDMNIYKNNLYAMASNWDSMGLFYNKKLLAKYNVSVPTTWDEWRTVAQKTTDIKNRQFGFLYYEFTTREWNLGYFNQYLVECGGTFWGDQNKTKIAINSPQGVEALQFFVDMIYKDKTCVPPTTEWNDVALRGVYDERIATWTWGPWVRPNLRTNAPNLDYGITLIPKNKQTSSFVMNESLAITKDCKNKDAAWEVIKWWLGKQGNYAWADYHQQCPARLDVMNDPHFSGDWFWKAFFDIGSRPDVASKPLCEGYDEMAVAISTELQAAFFQRKSVKQALDDAVKQGEAILAKARA